MNKEHDSYPDLDGQAENLAKHGAQSRFFSVCVRAMIHKFNSKTPQIGPADCTEKGAKTQEKWRAKDRTKYRTGKSSPVSGL